ncbi:patatin-like serine protein [Eutypa lata UCREL1]|uniref:Patatin-like serine protein n=1 Tax=Eutypa lata (strain UCR-EL1) TaxID=1287681 RepID=M7SDF0_EUTLA|nr:patatin-like serine protein [Eutypa lata UCREL1]
MAGVLAHGLNQGMTTQPCQTCGTTKGKTFTCIQCNSLAFCETCWPRWILHVPGATGWGGKPHEKADPIVVQRLRQILEPNRTEADHQAELIEDEDTTWFGFGRDASGNPIFEDHGRFAVIMGECHNTATERYPQLVSFIGETGSVQIPLASNVIELRPDTHNWAFESTVLGKLLSWGAASIDKSLNQPVLPHAVIVLNATEDVHEDEWDITNATNMLMSDIQGAISREPALGEYLETWRKRGKKISNTEQLLACYYASVTVIRIPTRGHYMLMDQQIDKLFELVKARCSESLLKKKQARMLANAEKLQLYLQAAFDHFSKDLDSPFDFVKEALRHNPVSRNFEGNILTLAVLIKNYSENETLRMNAKNIFLRMAPMIASCIMFDAVRQNLLGKLERIVYPLKSLVLGLFRLSQIYIGHAASETLRIRRKSADAVIGGIRGIVQLQVLKAIERVLGPKLPIQNFFDLMVGTGTGGVIAMGLGVNRWSVNESIKKFKAIVKEAFTPRELTNMPIFGTLSSLLHRSVYKTQPLEKALKGYFDDQAFFGGVSVKSQHYTPARVAVTATSVFDQQPVVFANYNRPDAVGEELPYEFVRYDTPTKEIKIWEATVPDMLLSIGTGSQVRDQAKPSNGRTSRATQASSGSSVHSNQQTRTPLVVPVLSTSGSQRMNEYKECDKAWTRFMSGSSHHLKVTDDSDHHYIRISPELLMPIPKFDQIQKMEDVEQEVEEVLLQMPEVKEIAHRLIASTFFFEKDPTSIRQTSSGYMCTGKTNVVPTFDLIPTGSICCRFRNSSDELKALGTFLWAHLKSNFEPYFLIEEDSTRWPARQVILNESMLEDMRLRGFFEVDRVRLHAVKEHSTTKISLGLQTTVYPSGVTVLPISGFPRQLMSEDGSHTAADERSVLLNSRHSVGEEIPQIQQGGPIVPMEQPVSPVVSSPTMTTATAELPESPAAPRLGELYGGNLATSPRQQALEGFGGFALELEGSSPPRMI